MQKNPIPVKLPAYLITSWYLAIKAGSISSTIGGLEDISLTGSGSVMSRPSSPNHFLTYSQPEVIITQVTGGGSL